MIELLDCEWGPYGEWSECSTTCDWGVKTSKRTKLQSAHSGGKECEGFDLRTEECREEPCLEDAFLEIDDRGKIYFYVIFLMY